MLKTQGPSHEGSLRWLLPAILPRAPTSPRHAQASPRCTHRQHVTKLRFRMLKKKRPVSADRTQQVFGSDIYRTPSIEQVSIAGAHVFKTAQAPVEPRAHAFQD